MVFVDCFGWANIRPATSTGATLAMKHRITRDILFPFALAEGCTVS